MPRFPLTPGNLVKHETLRVAYVEHGKGRSFAYVEKESERGLSDEELMANAVRFFEQNIDFYDPPPRE